MINPILERELKSRMRTWKTPVTIIIYLLLVALVTTLAFLIAGVNRNYGYGGVNLSAISGVYDTIVVFQLVLLVMILPIFTATAISGERERQTLDLLLCTDIPNWRIIFGKMTAALSYVMIIVIAAMPFVGLVLLFGGISIFEILGVVLYYMLTAVMLSSVGIFATTHFKRNITAILVSYFIVLILLFAPIFNTIIITTLIEGPLWNLGIDDFFEDYAYEVISLLFTTNPFYGITSLMNNDMFGIARNVTKSTTIFRFIKPWMHCSFFNTWFSALLLFLSTKRLGRRK